MNYKPIGFPQAPGWGVGPRNMTGFSQGPAQVPAGVPLQVPLQAPTAAPVQVPAAAPAQMPMAAPVQMPAAAPAQVAAAPQAQTQAAHTAASAAASSCIGSSDLDYLRDDIRGELEAINQYWRHIQAAKDPRVKTLLCEIMNDKKHHYAEVTKLIRQLDTYQDQMFRQTEG